MLKYWLGAKATAMQNLVKSLKSANVPIDGVGIEGHLIVGEVPSAATLEQNWKAFTALGVEISINELDIRMTLPETSALLSQQEKDYNTVITACVAVPGCIGMTLWDFTDKYSWVPSTFSGQGDACPWDAVSFSSYPSLPSSVPESILCNIEPAKETRLHRYPRRLGLIGHCMRAEIVFEQILIVFLVSWAHRAMLLSVTPPSIFKSKGYNDTVLPLNRDYMTVLALRKTGAPNLKERWRLKIELSRYFLRLYPILYPQLREYVCALLISPHGSHR